MTAQHAWFLAEGRSTFETIVDKRQARVQSLLSGMQSFAVACRLQRGWSRYLRAWESMAPAQCAFPLTLMHA